MIVRIVLGTREKSPIAAPISYDLNDFEIGAAIGKHFAIDAWKRKTLRYHLTNYHAGQASYASSSQGCRAY